MEQWHRLGKRGVIFVATLCFSLVLLNATDAAGSLPAHVRAAPNPAPEGQTNGTEKIAPGVQEALASLSDGEMITVIVTLKEQADLSQIADRDRTARLRKVISALQSTADATQTNLRALLGARHSEGRVRRVTYSWIFNGMVVTATRDVIEELAAQPEVFSITPNEAIQAPDPPSQPLLTLSAVESNLAISNIPALWALNFRGQGVVVANMDTGVDINHPDLSAQWRGGTNSWLDPYGEHPTVPADVKGHGTWTMGVMVGRDASGSAIGVAPDARWIAVKIFNDQGVATAEAIHKGFQWLLDPDGNRDTPDAPHVVSNSWAYQDTGCNLEFQLDLRALRAAGILPVFAAGNSGPGSSTSTSPANNPEALAVGATDNSGLIYLNSSRGPSACGEPQTTFPEVVAPGVSVRTSDLFGGYVFATGTSLAAPHVAGVLALLLSAYPDLTAGEQEAALINSAVDLGAVGPDKDYGYGSLDALAAYRWLSAVGGTGTTTATISIGLFQDFNLISLPIGLGASATPAQVLAPIEGSYDRVHAFNGCDTADHWKLYDPNVPDSVSDLTSIDGTAGLWITMNTPKVLTVSGTTPASTDIVLCAGWNLIGYPSMEKRPVTEVLAPIAGQYERVYAFDAGDPVDPWKLYDPAVPDFVNDLREFQPGFGYWIRIKDSINQTTLTIMNEPIQ